jgi:hypothetical protein
MIIPWGRGRGWAVPSVYCAEGLSCKRPIQYLASSEMCTPRLWCRGRTYSLGERGWGSIVRKTPDTALYSINVRTLWYTV